ncbi:dynactin subunit 2 [Polistes fuscatus]|uniref:dynactin subunit 2 n=1 Tax=Polistes fuscatus TaxID=30207 RepID=UPI001CA9952F|nr:dynactin subunit 2 [Polistes fuscatus]
MADAKYSDLPGIAYDQVDVYETTDLPESEQFEIYSEDESDSIEKLHINAREAFSKFKTKTVGDTKVDFSDSISRKSRTGYKFRDYELLGEDEKETPIQKYQRLQCEVRELYEEINALKENAKEENEEVKSAIDIISQVEQLGKEINDLKLEESLGSGLMELFSDPQGARLKQLISQIEVFRNTGISKSETEVKSEISETKETPPSGVLEYKMMYLPEKAKMQEIARIVQLEQRLCCLENIIGTSNENFSVFSRNLKCQGIMDAVQQLSAKAALLDTTQLDAIESRLSALIYRIDTIAQKKFALIPDSELKQKIEEMYKIVKKTESMSDILPLTINRMTSLSTIHEEAANYSKAMKQFEELQKQNTQFMDSNKCLLAGVQESFASNLEVIKNNITSLSERVAKLDK